MLHTFKHESLMQIIVICIWKEPYQPGQLPSEHQGKLGK